MKIAFCFSGLLRMGNPEATKNLLNVIENHGADVYASFWDDGENFEEDLQKFIDIFEPVTVEIEDHQCWKESTWDVIKEEVFPPIDLVHDSRERTMSGRIHSMFYKIWRANLLTKTANEKYDVVVRCRTDIMLDNDLVIEKNEHININNGMVHINAWKNCLGPHDLFAYATPENMDYYCSLYFYLSRYTKEGIYVYPPENLLRHHLAVRDKTICFFPSTLRDDIEKPLFSEVIPARRLSDSSQDPYHTFHKNIFYF